MPKREVAVDDQAQAGFKSVSKVVVSSLLEISQRLMTSSKAFIPAIPNVSARGQAAMRKQLNAVTETLHTHLVKVHEVIYEDRKHLLSLKSKEY